MPIFNLFSKRQKRERGEVPDVFKYDDFPSEFRVQVIHILHDALGTPRASPGIQNASAEVFKQIHDILAREYGKFKLHSESRNEEEALFNLFLQADNPETIIDIIEITFRVVDTIGRGSSFQMDAKTKVGPDEAIKELNQRFLEHGLGYQYEDGQVFRVDRKFIHAEATQPALRILAEDMYSGANQEFRSAHRHYRHGRYKECLGECNKTLESVLKTICDEHGWSYTERDTANTLLNICFDNELIPDFLQSHFSALRSSLQSGVPTTRNRMGSHGQGSTPKKVPSYIAGYILALTASDIVLLAEAEKHL